MNLEKTRRLFAKKVDKGGPVMPTQSTRCWVWTGFKERGYGRVRFESGPGPKLWQAHRLAWLLDTEVDPGENYVLHRCNNRACVRPDHLYLGDHQDNMRDAHREWGRRKLIELNCNKCLHPITEVV